MSVQIKIKHICPIDKSTICKSNNETCHDCKTYTKLLTDIRCMFCGHTGKDVLAYCAKIGGSDQIVKQIHCKDQVACLQRQIEATQ